MNAHRLSVWLAILLAASACSGSGSSSTTPPPPPEDPGPYATARYDTTFTDSYGVFPSTVTYPTSAEGAPFPIVSVAPGTCSAKAWYTWVGDQLASYGYVVIAFTAPHPCFGGPVPSAQGLVDALDFLVGEAARDGSPIAGLVDGSRRGIAGHSLGAIAALLAASDHPEIGAAVPLAPGPVGASAESKITTPTLILAASLDGIVPVDQAEEAYDQMSVAPREIAVVHGGNHIGFCTLGSICDVVGGLLDNPRELDEPGRQDQLMRRYTTAWFERYLRGRAEYDVYLSGAEAQADVASGVLSDLRYATP